MFLSPGPPAALPTCLRSVLPSLPFPHTGPTLHGARLDRPAVYNFFPLSYQLPNDYNTFAKEYRRMKDKAR